VAFGFPLEGYLPSAGNITTGLISALSGPANNSSLIQISTPVQQGNSGGPVMDLKGEVVGVVVGKADVIRIAKATGDILQNVNFAVSAATLQAFLDANRLEYKKSSYFSMAKKPDALVDEARAFTAKVECWR
jgi:S1-C subfamily serine protease